MSPPKKRIFSKPHFPILLALPLKFNVSDRLKQTVIVPNQPLVYALIPNKNKVRTLFSHSNEKIF